MRRLLGLLGIATILAGASVACGGDDGETITSIPADAAIGFVLVGSRDDLGYNQAIWEGADAVESAFPDHPVLRVENIPEDQAEVEAALEGLIDRGARVLFATSFGFGPGARAVAARHPEVVVVHQGGVEGAPDLPNFGTYFGAHYQPLYLAGIAAGATTTTGRLGYVVAYPIPATFLNVDAFTLGARSVRPDATTEVVFTRDWCDPGAQRRAFEELVSHGVDVVAQHQDCTRTILELAEEAGVRAVGYHVDGSEVAPTAWLAGAAWQWSGLFTDIVRTVLAGNFTGSPYDGDFLTQLSGRDSVIGLASLSASLPESTRSAIAAAEERIARDGGPFTGPIRDRDGIERVAAGQVLAEEELDSTDWFVEGVVGDVPE